MKAVRNFLMILAALAIPAWADTAQTVALVANMLPSNETPPTTVNATGNALILVHVIRDGTGTITSGSVEFNVGATFPGATNITGLHIHKGPVGQSGPIVIPTDVKSDPVDANFKISYDKFVNFPAAGAAEPTAAHHHGPGRQSGQLLCEHAHDRESGRRDSRAAHRGGRDHAHRSDEPGK